MNLQPVQTIMTAPCRLFSEARALLSTASGCRLVAGSPSIPHTAQNRIFPGGFHSWIFDMASAESESSRVVEGGQETKAPRTKVGWAGESRY